MKRIAILATTAIAALGLAACSPGIHGRIGYNIDFHNGMVVSHAPNQPNAYISADGSLRIGNRVVAVTPSQRTLLKDYYDQSRSLINAGKAVGEAGAQLGKNAISDVIKSIFSAHSKQAGTSIDAQANAIAASAQKLCTGIQQIHATQQAIAADLPAFKPYDAVGDTHCVVTTTHSTTVASGSGSGATTRSVTLSNSASATANQVTRSSATSAATSPKTVATHATNKGHQP